MRTLRLSLAGTVTLAMLGGLAGAAMAQSEEGAPTAFPTGTLVSVESGDMLLEFNEDGTGLVYAEGITMPIVYATVGNLYTEMMFDYPTDPKVPATYYWDFDGEHLTMELWGEDYQPHRNFMYADNTWMPIEDPQAVVVAALDFDAGDAITFGLTTQGYVPAAAVPPDAYTSDRDVRNRVAAVPISKGQPITPDMLAPAE